MLSSVKHLPSRTRKALKETNTLGYFESLLVVKKKFYDTENWPFETASEKKSHQIVFIVSIYLFREREGEALKGKNGQFGLAHSFDWIFCPDFLDEKGKKFLQVKKWHKHGGFNNARQRVIDFLQAINRSLPIACSVLFQLKNISIYTNGLIKSFMVRLFT